ncbi:MAG TPA: cupredoxin family copper-binding protein [Telluria sp.]|nr:cupredoxin family copper-binding protein [Telluria sp.]
MRRLLYGALAGLALAGPVRAAPQTHTVTIEGMEFRPARLAVHAGDTIVWRNQDIVPHAVNAAGIASGEIGPGKTWTYKAVKPGDFAYICPYHPTMKASLTVRRGSAR